METIELQLDEQTLRRARQLAASRGVSLEKLIEGLLADAEAPAERGGGLIGLFRDDPELMDEVVGLAMQARARDPFRLERG